MFPTTTEDLWEAITSPERLPRWFEPVEGELHQGGRYRLTASETVGTIEKCDPPRLLRLTWEVGGDTSTVEVTVGPEGDRARLTLCHTVPDNEHWDTYGPGAAGIGWETALVGLAAYASGAPDSELAELANLAETQQGRALVEAGARAWASADIEGGADRDAAQRRGGRTAAFYLGEE